MAVLRSVLTSTAVLLIALGTPSSTLAQSSNAATGTSISAGNTIPAALSWVRLPGAESCLAPQTLARFVEARLGHRVFYPLADAELSIEGTVEHTQNPDGWRATLRASRGGGEVGMREVRVQAPDCAAIDERLLVVLSLLLERAAPFSAATPTENPPQPTPAPTCPPQVSSVATTPPPANLPTPALLRLQGSLGAWSSLAPSMAFGAGFGARFRPQHTVGAEVVWYGWFAPQGFPNAGSYGGTTLTAAVLFSPPAFRWWSLGVGIASGMLFPALPSETNTLFWLAGMARMAVHIPLPNRWIVGTTGTLFVPLLAPQWLQPAENGENTVVSTIPWVGPGLEIFFGRDFG